MDNYECIKIETRIEDGNWVTTISAYRSLSMTGDAKFGEIYKTSPCSNKGISRQSAMRWLLKSWMCEVSGESVESEGQFERQVKELYPEMYEALKSAIKANFELFCKKQLDYGSENIRRGQDLSTPNGRRKALYALAVRMQDKLSRMENILWNGLETNNESLEDSFIDFAVYGQICQLVNRDKWGK